MLLVRSAGPEVTAEAVRVLELISKKTDLNLDIQSHHFGGAGIDNFGVPLPDSTLEACESADAVLLGEFVIGTILRLIAQRYKL